MINHYNGFVFIENKLMTVPGEPYELVRTWKERLLSLPWRPLKKTKTVVPQVPSKEVIRAGNKLYAHPELIREMMQLIKNNDERLIKNNVSCTQRI